MLTTVCTSCNEAIAHEDQKAHYRSERHMYNVKRKLEGAAPIPADTWEKKLQRFAEMQKESAKKTDHIKKNKTEKQAKSVTSQATASEEVPYPRRCLFDAQSFPSVEKNLDYMKTQYSFFIPERPYCKDVDGLLNFLHLKIHEGHQCLFCDRTFPTELACRQHMTDKNHTRIGTEGYTRAGHYSDDVTQELKAQIEEFYDFSESYKELRIENRTAGDQLMLKLNSKERQRELKEEMSDSEKLKEMFEFFDEDKDGVLSYQEALDFYDFATENDTSPEDGADYQPSLDEATYASFASNFEGKFSLGALQQFYELSNRSVSEDFDRYLDEYEILDNPDDEGFIQCTNEVEFQEVMQKYGLKQAKILPCGSLQLPDGSEAGHRQLNYIYRQRGVRKDVDTRQVKAQKALNNIGGFGARLALTGVTAAKTDTTAAIQKYQGTRYANCMVAVSQLKKDGRHVMAIFRENQKRRMKQGIKDTTINRGRTIRAMDYVR